MGSLLITSFSCTHTSIKTTKMKVFATLATLLGASTATPLMQNQLHASSNLRMNQHSMIPSMGMSMESQMSQHDSSNRHMDMKNQMSTMRDMYSDNQDVPSNMMKLNMMGHEMHPNMLGQERSSNTMDVHRQNQAIDPNQYFVKDDFGNYAYGYNDQKSERSEEGNSQAIKGHYAYIMSNGVKRRVDYVADDQGFHIIRDNADPARIKRSVEPDLIHTRMTSVMDSSSLRDDALNMLRMSNMMGTNQLKYSNTMGSNIMDQNSIGGHMMDRSMVGQETMRRNMIGHNSMDRDMREHTIMGQETMGHDMMNGNMMGRNIYNIMSNRGMTADASNMITGNLMAKQQMNSKIMDQDLSSSIANHNMLGQREMVPNMMYRNMMDQANDRMSANMNSRGMSSSMMNSNNGLMGQRMMQKMEIEHVPEAHTSTRFF